MTDTNNRIFLSYSHDEHPFARAVADELRSRGLEALDPADSTSSERAAHEQALDLLTSAGAAVFFLGSAATSPWMNFEIGAAVGGGKPVVAVSLTEEGLGKMAPRVAQMGIRAHDLKPDQVAERIAEALGLTPVAQT